MNDRLTLVQTYLQWWEMAGFDHAVDTKTVNWLEAKAQKQTQSALKNESQARSSADNGSHHRPESHIKSADVTDHISETPIDTKNWPQTIDELHNLMRSDNILPGSTYDSQKVLPRVIEAWRIDKNGEKVKSLGTLMLIGDIPNDQDIREKTIFSGKQNDLIVNMMTACGFDAFDLYCANIASTKPQFDELPEQDLPSLHALLRHHIALVNPKAIISLGSATCNALLNAELMKSRENLHYFNHNNIIKALIATFHPRSLIAKPQLKRQAWRDLQVMMKKEFL